ARNDGDGRVRSRPRADATRRGAASAVRVRCAEHRRPGGTRAARRTGCSAAFAEGVHSRRRPAGPPFRFRQVRHPSRGLEDARSQRLVAQVERREPGADRGPHRRARHQRVQPGPRRAACEGDHELPRLTGHPGQPHHHHQLRRGAADLQREDRVVLGQKSARALSGQVALSPRDIPGRRLALLLGVVLSLAGCAGVQEATGVATQQDLFQIRQDVAAAQQTATRAKADADAVSAQLKNRPGGESDKQVAALSRQVDNLAETLTTLTGRVDELATRLDTLTRQRTSQGPLMSGSAAPRSSSAAPSGSATPASPGAAAPGAVAAAPQRPPAASLQPQDIYQTAYIDFSKGSYSLAIAGFREFLRRYPDHELAGSAQYWIGEA